MKVSLVIPTYYCKPGHYEYYERGCFFYDHPTPLNEEGTLKRLLDSLDILEIPNGVDLNVVVIPAGNTPDIQTRAEEKVRKLTEKYRNYRFEIVTNSRIKRMDEYAKDHGFDLRSFAAMESYPKVRNLCILIPFILDSDVVILIDDDERFEEPGFIKKAIEFVGRNGRHAIAGYYVMASPRDGKNTCFNLKRFPWWRRLFRVWNTYFYINKTFKKLIFSESRLKPAPIALGGNTVLSREIISRVPFDPSIPRGEDIDYLLNSRLMGYQFYFDNKLEIKHLPPKYKKRYWESIRMNMFRFLIMRDKIEKQGKLSVNDFMYYPGTFLKKNLIFRILITNTLLSLEYLLKRNPRSIMKCMGTVLMAIRYLKNKKERERAYDNYMELQKEWERFMNFVEKNREKLSKLYEGEP